MRYPLKYLTTLGLLGAAVLAAPVASYAQHVGYATKSVNLRAGPARDYPVVFVATRGAPLQVLGCLNGYQWCDVAVGRNRGWVFANNISYPYQGHNAPMIRVGAAVGIGIIAFSVGSYWDSHYRSRPWYGQRSRWVGRPVHARPPQARPPHVRPPHASPAQVRPAQVRPPVANHRPTQRPPSAHPPGAGRPIPLPAR